MIRSVRTVRSSLLSRGMKYLIAGILLLGAIMLYLLSSANSNTPMFARSLPLLLFFGVALLLGLMVLVGYQLLALKRRLKARLFGSKLTLRLVLLFPWWPCCLACWCTRFPFSFSTRVSSPGSTCGWTKHSKGA